MHQSTVILLLLYAVAVILVGLRIYQILFIDRGFIFGDVTYDYFPAGIRILNGESPYQSPFIHHPPMMLFLFAGLVWIMADPLVIGISIMAGFLTIPYLSYKAAMHAHIGTVVISVILTIFLMSSLKRLSTDRKQVGKPRRAQGKLVGIRTEDG